MIENLIQSGQKGFQRIRVAGNSIELERLSARTLDTDEPWHTKFYMDYDVVTPYFIGEHKFVEARNASSLDVFSIDNCKLICQVSRDALTNYKRASGEFFVIIRLPDETQQIYDEIGHLIASSNDDSIDVVSTGWDPLIKRTDKSGKVSLWTLEGYLVGTP